MRSRSRIVVPLLLVVGATVACFESAKPPPRRLGIPSTASWAPRAPNAPSAASATTKGDGVWVDCWRTEQAEDRFDCTIYLVDTRVEAKGRYALVDDVPPNVRPTAEPRKVIRYTEFDGTLLRVDGARIMAPERCVACTGDGAAATCTLRCDR